MSNLIKYPFTPDLRKKDVYVVNTEEKEKFASFNKKLKEQKQQEEDQNKEFVTGLPIRNDMKILEECKENAKEEAARILEEAKSSADQLLLDAQNNVKMIHSDAYETGKAEGFSAGEVAAKEQYRLLEEELQEKMEQKEAEYKALIDEIEPRYVEVMISLIQKLTGVILENHNELLLYLIKQCVGNLDKSKKYIIRVSKEDIHRIEPHKEEIKEIAGGASVEYWEEKGLNKNECIIETDTQMVDCGFQTQLSKLTETLRFLV